MGSLLFYAVFTCNLEAWNKVSYYIHMCFKLISLQSKSSCLFIIVYHWRPPNRYCNLVHPAQFMMTPTMSLNNTNSVLTCRISKPVSYVPPCSLCMRTCHHSIYMYNNNVQISNQIPRKVCNEITYPFINFKGWDVEVWELICSFTPHFIIIAVYINLNDLNDYTYICTSIATHYNKENVHVFCIWLQCVCITPNNCFK